MIQTQFETTVLSFGNNTGIEVPMEHIQALGTSKIPPVMVKIFDYEYQTTVARMNNAYMISLSKMHREKIGIKGGDKIIVTLTLIEGKREVEVPDVLKSYLDKHDLTNNFHALSYSVKKEMVRKVLEAKKPETLEKRLQDLKLTLNNK